MLALGVYMLPLAPRDRELQQWAAQGLAYTCWMTYADSEAGLGPDEVGMTTGREGQNAKWLDALAEWEEEGRPGGKPPGTRNVPVARGANAERDYFAKKAGYLLRPEVRPLVVMNGEGLMCGRALMACGRRWRASTTCGGLRGTTCGENADGPCLRRLRGSRGRAVGTRACGLCWSRLRGIRMRCRGECNRSSSRLLLNVVCFSFFTAET